jgi:hypothetical protein
MDRASFDGTTSGTPAAESDRGREEEDARLTRRVMNRNKEKKEADTDAKFRITDLLQDC